MLGSFFSLSVGKNNCSTSNTATDSSVQTSASRLLSLMVVGGKTIIIMDGSETPNSLTTAVSLHQVDFQLPAMAKN